LRDGQTRVVGQRIGSLLAVGQF